jgi:hydroxymethylbilane synthase
LSTLTLGTRGSQLALWQAHHVRDRLQAIHHGLTVRIEVISTQGDRILDRPLAAIGGKGLFVKEIEQALLDGTIDLAVHSLKDMPTEQPEGLALVAFPASASPDDALCARDPLASLSDLRAGARVGTGSLRRGAQLKRLRPDLQIEGIRGNVETRLAKRFSTNDPLDAVVLARAGLERLGLWESGFLPLGPPDLLPAPGQGVLAIETRADDTPTRSLVEPLNDRTAMLRVSAERACLAGIEGNCHTPFAAFAQVSADRVTLDARLLDDDGVMREASRASAAELHAVVAMGHEVAAALLRQA